MPAISASLPPFAAGIVEFFRSPLVPGV